MKKYLIILALALTLVMSGCNGGSDGNVGANWNTFIGGTEGVNLRYDIDAPPAEVNIGDEFMVMLVLENMGEHTIQAEDYFVQLKGFSPQEFGTTSGELIVSGSDVGEPLQANEMNPDTGETLESYPVYVEIPQGTPLRYGGSIAGNTPFPFAADVCYTYKTTANGKLCIKEDLTKSSDTKVCMVSGPQGITSSGAPVQITNLQEFGGGRDSVRFSFSVMAANTGGEISTPGSECSDVYSDENKMRVTVTTGIPGLNCNGFVGEKTGEGSDSVSGYVKLSGSSRQITCTQDLMGRHDTDYVKVIEITAEYDYEQSISTQVLVKNIS